MNKKTILNISNFNIMSPSSAKYFFTKNNLILDNHEKTLDKIVNINELQLDYHIFVIIFLIILIIIFKYIFSEYP